MCGCLCPHVSFSGSDFTLSHGLKHVMSSSQLAWPRQRTAVPPRSPFPHRTWLSPRASLSAHPLTPPLLSKTKVLYWIEQWLHKDMFMSQHWEPGTVTYLEKGLCRAEVFPRPGPHWPLPESSLQMLHFLPDSLHGTQILVSGSACTRRPKTRISL